MSGILSWILKIIFLLLLFSVAVSDAKTMKIPDKLNLAILALGLVSIFVMPEISILNRMTGFVCVSVPMLLVAILVPGGFGGGDIKLVAVSGLFLGWKCNALAAVLGIFFAGFYGGWLLLVKKAERKSSFAFGPFLCMGMGIALIFGTEMIGKI